MMTTHTAAPTIGVASAAKHLLGTKGDQIELIVSGGHHFWSTEFAAFFTAKLEANRGFVTGWHWHAPAMDDAARRVIGLNNSLFSEFREDEDRSIGAEASKVRLLEDPK
jgi:hypothetical protein